MRRALAICVAGAIAAVSCGCATGPLLENPALIRGGNGCVNLAADNPVYIPLGPNAYASVFEKVLDAVGDTFEIAYANRYDGRIESFPRVAPGYERIFMPGSPDYRERLLATLQSVRHRCQVLIQPADDGGFFVDVKVLKELEDVGRPVKATAGDAAFRSDNTVDRQFEVIDPIVVESNWIPIGRDTGMEQCILEKVRKCL
jgi:hypothetical protein